MRPVQRYFWTDDGSKLKLGAEDTTSIAFAKLNGESMMRPGHVPARAPES